MFIELGTKDTSIGNENWQANSDKYGDAVWETAGRAMILCNYYGPTSWYSSTNRFPGIVTPFFARGCGDRQTNKKLFPFSFSSTYGEEGNIFFVCMNGV